ncbi:uncharacterized protein N7498_010332 [Penicillium cinerascens]|uniref:DUF7907 domain-containing protein n=1 Tax=Penicillium cinerascens TaxID=70096 RepID=A0A9W9M8T8_9EURO|nr:uncharacterized protein N7498_010332 [Penicillium cinerascens]KAJ5191347.1 hypothetical protein N7498_010332 [Penicillium cinerascens]
MRFLSVIALLAATAVANPVARSTKKEFHLKTTGAAKADFNDLFVITYHTGAGTNDALLENKGSIATPFYLNGTTALANLGNVFPWGFEMGGDSNYASWESVQINAGGGVDGFSIKDGNFVWSEEEGFGGWLVCDWYHNAPQLFWWDKYYPPTIPCSCSKVDLKPIYLTQ